MPEFAYEALAGTGQRSQGTLTAGSEREVQSMLDARGLFPVRIQPVKGKATAHKSSKRVKARHMAGFYSQLADLLHSGVPLLRSLDILERQSSLPALGEVLRDIRAKVADGTSLGDAMAAHPRAFNDLSISMVRAGQEGGFLEDVLHRIADFTEHQEDLKAKVVGAMAYPVLLLSVGFVVLNALVIFVVPQFRPIFSALEKQGELPFLTSMLMNVSYFLQHRGWIPLVVIILAIYFYRRWAKTDKGRLMVDGFRLHLPIMGTIYRNLALSRFTRILGTLLHNGIPIVQSLKIAKDSTGNRVLTDAIDKATESITAGKALAAPLAASKHFPRDVVEMVSVGEESNSLEKVLIDIANSLEKRTGRQLEMFVRLLEPIMLLVMAAVTLLVVAGLLLPIFKMSSTVS